MAKKKSGKEVSKAATKAAKKEKATKKIERKEKKKKVSKSKDAEEDDEDLEGILDKMRREWEEAHHVTEELVEGPPSRRANATLTPCPNGNHLWCIGGEFFSDDGKAYFYNDVFRYSPEKDEWRKFVSQTCPGPRSAHAVVASPAGGGKLFLFGGEFSSLHQNSFHHYRDFWVFDIATHAWDRIDTKVRPAARSGHRMAMWKHFVVLFGGFYDPGLRTNYLNDLWLFDTQEYKWRQVEFKDTDRKPSPRSGFSFLPTPDGILLHGGYCKEYAKGQRPVGVMLDDTWFLRMTLAETDGKRADALALKCQWERRKRPATAYAPSLRSGCTMALWAPRGTGVLFGGVTDEDTSEETLESTFHNDLYGYQIAGNGRWMSMLLKRPKKKAGGAVKKKAMAAAPVRPSSVDDDDDDDGRSDDDGNEDTREKPLPLKSTRPPEPAPEADSDDPNATAPMPRYNAMLAVLRNTLFIYGGIFERGAREYTLDDFHALQLDKMDRFVCLKPSGIVIPAEGDDASSEDDDDDDDDGEDGDEDSGDENQDSEDEAPPQTPVADDGGDDVRVSDMADDAADAPGPELSQAEKVSTTVYDASRIECTLAISDAHALQDALRAQATAFMGVARDAARSAEDVLSTPLPGETLAMFYARSREYWTQKAHGSSANRGKLLRRDAFALAEERYAVNKPILKEVERILAEAGLDEEEMRRGAAAGPAGSGGESRNRR